jgi:hypothetical protein
MELPLGEEPLTTFRQALERVSALAHAKLPAELHGHLERATALVIHRHVWLGDDSRHAQVLSSDGQTWYRVNGACTCMDAPRAPQGYCKHKLAVMLYRRASELLATSACGGGVTAAAALPEAPASVNVRLCVEGHECQFTMRDSDEARLVERLQALLARFPQAAKTTASAATQTNTAPAPASAPICPVHGPMKESSKAPGTWFCSKKLFDGSYCKERMPK